jgi:hypothetical protein
MGRKLGAMPIRLSNGRLVYETSVPARLLDLLEAYTLDGQWFTIHELQNEYAERFGEVKWETLRRTVLRELARDDCVMRVRYSGFRGTRVPVLEVSSEGPIFEEA